MPFFSGSSSENVPRSNYYVEALILLPIPAKIDPIPIMQDDQSSAEEYELVSRKLSNSFYGMCFYYYSMEIVESLDVSCSSNNMYNSYFL